MIDLGRTAAVLLVVLLVAVLGGWGIPTRHLAEERREREL